VVRPRLADAKFFFDQDRKKPLESRVEALERVVYHNKLGSQGARLVRVAKIAAAIALKLRPADDDFVANVAEAARLAKADLLTDMVGEFPELQGIMGRYYALHDGLSDDIPFAIEDHYKPRFAGDELPRSDVGICVALADKLETLVGMFGIGNMPTGEKDPFALRRHALGVARLIVDRELPLTVRDLVRIAYQTFDTESLTSLKEIQPFLEIFFQERLVRYLESAGYEQRFIAAALSVQGMPHWTAIRGRLAALKAFAILPESESLAAANKRVGNILKKAEGSVPIEIEPALFKEPAETALHAALKQIQAKADSAFESGDYTASLQALAALRAPVDAFFDNVMVNSDDPALKANRLALLNQLHHTMNRVADLSMLAA
jgi:glycyl-tRNA synthetase beta chain